MSKRITIAGKKGTLFVREGLWIADNSKHRFIGMKGYSKFGEKPTSKIKKVM